MRWIGKAAVAEIKMAESGTQSLAEIPSSRRHWITWRPSPSLLIAFAALSLGIGSFIVQVIQHRKLESRLQELEWANEVREQDSYLNAVEPSVGMIQFLKRGYTIEFTK